MVQIYSKRLCVSSEKFSSGELFFDRFGLGLLWREDGVFGLSLLSELFAADQQIQTRLSKGFGACHILEFKDRAFQRKTAVMSEDTVGAGNKTEGSGGKFNFFDASGRNKTPALSQGGARIAMTAQGVTTTPIQACV